MQIIFYRILFAGLFFLPMIIKRPAPKLTWKLVSMVICFGLMNFFYVSAIRLTTAANAIFLQYTASIWMVIFGYVFLSESVSKRTLASLVLSIGGIGIIIVGHWVANPLGIALALLAGLFYGALAFFIRLLNQEDAIWLTFLNHMGGALLTLPFLLTSPEEAIPSSIGMVVVLAFFGIIQLGTPYLLFSKALKVLPTQEAAILTLFEPILNPILTYLVVGEKISTATLVGGCLILVGISARYLPVLFAKKA